MRLVGRKRSWGQGPALIATQGSQSAFPSDDVTIVHLNADGSVGASQTVHLPIGNISGFCFSATAAGGAGMYAARRLNSLWKATSEFRGTT